MVVMVMAMVMVMVVRCSSGGYQYENEI